MESQECPNCHEGEQVFEQALIRGTALFDIDGNFKALVDGTKGASQHWECGYCGHRWNE